MTSSAPIPTQFTTSTPNARGPLGKLPITGEMLLNWSSGDIFGLSQDAGMGWTPSHLARKEFLILSTSGGIRSDDGTPIALGYHPGHWEVGLLHAGRRARVQRARRVPVRRFLHRSVRWPHAGTPGMMDSLAYRQRRRHDFFAGSSLAARARSGRDGRRNLRQGSAGDDDGIGVDARSAVHSRSRRRHLAAD